MTRTRPQEASEGKYYFYSRTFFKVFGIGKSLLFHRYVVTQNVESKELVIFCHGPQTQQDRPKMMDIDNVRTMPTTRLRLIVGFLRSLLLSGLSLFLLQWNPNEIQFRRSPDIVTKPSNFSVQSLTTSTTEKAIKDTSKPAESRETIDGLYHSPGQHDIRIHKKKDNEHSEHVHQRKDCFPHF